MIVTNIVLILRLLLKFGQKTLIEIEEVQIDHHNHVLICIFRLGKGCVSWENQDFYNN
jgi:hypothetical protein